MNKEYKTFEELKEELGDKFEEFMYKANIELLNKLEQKENIIKEVREIFKYYGDRGDIVGYSNYFISGEALIKLLEILDNVSCETMKGGERDVNDYSDCS